MGGDGICNPNVVFHLLHFNSLLKSSLALPRSAWPLTTLIPAVQAAPVWHDGLEPSQVSPALHNLLLRSHKGQIVPHFEAAAMSGEVCERHYA